jgi:predicted  nucleic acid-binding Zn-ribbon protein
MVSISVVQKLLVLAIAGLGLVAVVHGNNDEAVYLRTDRELEISCKKGWKEIVVAVVDGDEYTACKPSCDGLKPKKANKLAADIQKAHDSFDQLENVTNALVEKQGDLEAAEAAEDTAEAKWLDRRCETGDAFFKAKQARREAQKTQRQYETAATDLAVITAIHGDESSKAKRKVMEVESLQAIRDAKDNAADTLEAHAIANQTALDNAKAELDAARAVCVQATKALSAAEKAVTKAANVHKKAAAKANKKICYTECDLGESPDACWKTVKGVETCALGDECLTCEGNCGFQVGNCHCDSLCVSLGDCCPDVTEFCGYGPWP